MKTLALALLFFSALGGLSGCDPYDTRLQIVNHTAHTISIATFADTLPDYPALNQPAYYLTHDILPGKRASQLAFGSTKAWPETIQLSKNNKLNVFVYANDTVAKYQDMNTLNSQHLYRRLSLTRQQLEATGWVVEVPAP